MVVVMVVVVVVETRWASTTYQLNGEKYRNMIKC
jgi:hypothetical protein